MAFVPYNPSTNTPPSLVSAIFAPSPGVALVNDSIGVVYAVPPGETSSIAYYDAGTPGLGIGAGLFLSTGDPTPASSKTTPGVFGNDLNPASAPDLLQVITTAYDGFSTGPDPDTGVGGVFDVTWLQFQVNVTDPTVHGLGLDLVFASEEVHPGSNGQFPDIAGVFVDGVDYALYGGDAMQPLAVTNRNADKFIDNSGSTVPIEFNGLTPKLHMTAPVHLGVNMIKVAIADTGESGFDSGLFVSGVHAVAYDAFGHGILPVTALTGTGKVMDTAGSTLYQGNAQGNSIELVSGFDVVDGGAGLDQATFEYSPAAIDLAATTWNGTTLEIHSGANAAQLTNVERVHFAGNYLFALDTGPTGTTYEVYALLEAALNTAPTRAMLSQWVANADAQFASGHDLGDVGQAIIDYYAPSASKEQIVTVLYQNVVGVTPSGDTVASLAAQVGPGHTFETLGDLYATASLLSFNTDEILTVVGSVQQLDAAYFP